MEMSNEIEGQTAVGASVHGNGLEARRRIRFSSRTHTTKRSSMVIVCFLSWTYVLRYMITVLHQVLLRNKSQASHDMKCCKVYKQIIDI